MRRILALGSAICLTATAASVSAQTTVGGSFIVSRLPSEAYVPGTVAVPPSGLTTGAVVFGGAAVAPRIAVQAEVSIPAQLTTLRTSSHPGTTIEDRTEHRDTIVSGLLRVRAAAWCEVLVGGGVTFERTSVEQTYRSHLTGETSAGVRESSATRATFTTGVDLPVRLHRYLSVVPTGRIHVIARSSEQPALDTRPFSPPSTYVFRLGIGARVEF